LSALGTLPRRTLGDSELEVPVVGLGCNNFGRRIGLDETRSVVDAALDAGVYFLDTADVYGSSEDFLGEVLEGRREQVVLATKFGADRDGSLPGAPGSAEYVSAACERSLRRLRIDVIDLYQYHLPNPDVPIAETVGAMDELVRAGKVRFLGVSNFSAEQLAEACRVARVVSLQNEYSLLRRGIERDVVPACERLGVSVIPYFPLASGLLTGKYRRGEPAPSDSRLAGRDSIATEEEWDVIEALSRFASERGIEPVDVAIGGLAAQPAVASVIAGAKRPEQARRNAQAGLWEPSPEDLAELRRISDQD
jgi:aryl-alcohol dehydrogenase-like predicted oxidoreductase